MPVVGNVDMGYNTALPVPLPAVNAQDFNTYKNPYRENGDDSVAIQAAIDYATRQFGAANVFIGPGRLILKHPLSITGNISLIGTGPASTIVTVEYTSATDIIVVGAGSSNPSGVVISGIQFVMSASYAHTGGAMVHFRNCHNCTLEDCTFWDGFYYMCLVNGGAGQYINYIRKCEFNPSNTGTGAAAIAVGVDSFAQNVWIEDIEMGGGNGGQTGIAAFWCGGLQLRNISIIEMKRTAVAIAPATGQQAINVFMDNVECDSSAVDHPELGGMVITTTNGGDVHDVRGVNCWFSNNGFNGVSYGAAAGLIVVGTVAHPVMGLHLAMPMFAQNGGHGCSLSADVQDVDMSIPVFANNGQATTATYDGLICLASKVSIVGGRSGDVDGLTGLGAKQLYGYAYGDPTDYLSLVGATATGNTAAGLFNGSTGTHNNIVTPIG